MPTGAAPRADLGRAILIPVFGTLLVLNAARLIDELGSRSVLVSLGTATALAFYCVITLMYLRRGAAHDTDRRPWVWVLAGAATFSPFLVPLGGAPSPSSELAATVGSGLIVVGVALSIWALLHLRTNISVVPQARALASSGPYRWFRHPLYVFEYVAAIGLALVTGGWWAWVVVAGLAVLQILRARWEEQLLSEQVEGYAAYAARTRGFS